MTLPIFYDDVTQGVVKYLMAQPEIVDAIGYDTEEPWIFQDRTLVNLEGKSQELGDRAVALVIAPRGGWTAPNLHNTMRFPRISVDIYADPMRDGSFNVIDTSEPRRRIAYVHSIVTKYLHRPDSFDEQWGSVRVLSSVRQDELTMYPVGDGDGLLRGLCYYALTTG